MLTSCAHFAQIMRYELQFMQRLIICELLVKQFDNCFLRFSAGIRLLNLKPPPALQMRTRHDKSIR